MFVPASHGQRVAIIAVLVVPLVAIVVLSAPAWLIWPFLTGERRTTVLEFLDRLIEWITVLAGIAGATTKLDVQPRLPPESTATPLSASPSNVITDADLRIRAKAHQPLAVPRNLQTTRVHRTSQQELVKGPPDMKLQ
jgi:hypothetical protein